MNVQIKNLDLVALTQDLAESGLAAGDVGVVLESHGRRGKPDVGYTLEFTSVTGDTIAVVDVPAESVRPIGANDVRHARQRAHVA